MVNIDYYSDPSHGWYRISLAALKRYVPEVINSISRDSYISKDMKFVYLEEDSDMTLVSKAFEAKNFELKVKNSFFGDKRSKIRNLKRYDVLALLLEELRQEENKRIRI